MTPPLRHSSRRPEDKTSRFLGVSRSPIGKNRPWSAGIAVDGHRESLGFWEAERDAAEAYDRAALHYLGRRARRNFPERRLAAADPGTLRVEARRRFKLHTASRHRGVFELRRRWQARINHGGEHEALGAWRTQREAAEAYDRAARFFFGDLAELNFPHRRLEPRSPAEIRRLSRLARKTGVKTSKYVGAYLSRRKASRPWIAEIAPPRGDRRYLGSWRSQLDAARAYDRAARFYLGVRAELNFPDEKLEPADAATLAAEARKETKATCASRYIGVTLAKRHDVWRASTKHKGQMFHLGDFKREHEAGEAYDAKSIELRGAFARVNFHPVTGEQVWGKRPIDLLPMGGSRWQSSLPGRRHPRSARLM